MLPIYFEQNRGEVPHSKHFVLKKEAKYLQVTCKCYSTFTESTLAIVVLEVLDPL